jgi:hypothetical protein
MQQVQASLLPFHLHRQTLEVPNGLTLDQMVDCVFPHRKIPGIKIVINIGDQVIPPSQWKNIKPKAHTLVGINAIAAGGGGGKKNPLTALIAIALVVAAPYIVAAIAPTAAAAVTAGTATFGQTLAVSAIRIGISMVGFLATSMLSSVPKQRAQAAPSAAEATTQFIEGASNSINRYGTIPVNLGVNRMFPPQAALPYTETSANKQYVRQLFTYGFGKVQISDRKIGETALSEYDGVEIVDRLNGDLNTGTPLYSTDVVQDGYSVVASAAAGYITRTTQPNVDEAQVDLTFSSGLTEYNSQAQRLNRTVSFEVRYALTGTSDWVNRAVDVSYGEQSVTVPFPTAWNPTTGKRVGYAILVLNLTNGVVSAVSYDFGSTPIVPLNCIRIASLRTESTSTTPSSGDIFNLIDERANYIPSFIEASGDFAFTYGGTGLSIDIATGTVKGSNNGVTNITVTDATAQALRITKSLKFPTRDQYDIQVKRLTADSASDQIRDVATLTAIRSIRYTAPVNQENVSGSAMRVLATDQLNGTIDRYNCIASTLMKDYDATLEEWIDDVITSNPASIYRYVLQATAFIKALPDNRIDLEKLQEWHAFCLENNLTYNRIIDQPISIDDLLNDIAAAGMATPHKINGNYSVLIDNERPDIKGMVTPRNSWGYNGSITYPDLPHALRVQFRNAAKGYILDERIVYADGYDEETATLYERLQFDSCTNSDLAWFYGRIYMATVLLQPEVHNWNMDFENLTFNRGDKIVFVNDVILVGVGQGRIRELIYDDPDDPTEVLGFILDETVSIPTVDDFGVRIRHGDASGFTYHGLTTTVGEMDEFMFTTAIPIEDAPPLDSLCAFTEFGSELELVITEIRMNKDHSASVTAVNYAPERYDAVSGVIPPFDSNITLPANFYRPLPPVLAGEIQSDETVMLKNSDGSYTTRMIIPLTNDNEPSVQTVVRARVTGATEFFRPNILSATAEQVILTGLEDGTSYDLRIYYQRQGGLELLSKSLDLNNVLYRGAFAKPADVEDFHLTVSDSIGLFQWTANQDIDLSHYTMRFSRVTDGATWVSSQIVAEDIVGNRLTIPIQSGTYLIKAVDILGNESVNASIIISIDNGALGNVVETLTQQPTWAGVMENVEIDDDDRIILIDPEEVGYYYFDPAPFDLGAIYESVLSSTIIAGGIFYDPALSAKIRSLTSVRGAPSIRGTESSDWAVFLEFRKSMDGIDWGDGWVPFIVGKHIFEYVEFRLRLESYNPLLSPFVSQASVVIDMPDRIEKAVDVECDASTGATILYDVPFKNNPAVNITLQDGEVDDKIEYISKTNAGFQIKVYNGTAAGYVDRVFDYTSAGYGRVIS